jgi:hypothetical protein
MTPTSARIPRPSQASYKAAELIHRDGPMMERDLFALIDFGARASNRASALDRAIDAGWLTRSNDRIALTDFAREYLDAKPKERYVGKVAEPRSINMMKRKPYSPPKRIPRDDEPEWSRRGGATVYRVA